MSVLTATVPGRPKVAVGDLVRTGDNFHPHYCVIAISGDRAWVREVQHHSDHIVPYERCTRIDPACNASSHRPHIRAAGPSNLSAEEQRSFAA